MTVYTYSQARQSFSNVLDRARQEGSVQIRRKDGQIFTISPLKKSTTSPFSIKGIKTRVKTEDILKAIRESRSRAG